jgi:hypothetical protein
MNNDSNPDIPAVATSVDEMERLRLENATLRDQLASSMQKASLYYIAMSQLDTMRNSSRSPQIERAELIDACVGTEEDYGEKRVKNDFAEAEIQTDDNLASASIIRRMEFQSVQDELTMIRSIQSVSEKTERSRIQFFQRVTALIDELETPSQPVLNTTHPIISSIINGYSDLFEEYLRSNYISINHSIEIKRRDAMISSLLDKLKMMEIAFSKNIIMSESLAESRREVIKELSEQMKMLMNANLSAGNGLSEIEDLKAELSMARSNWAATRDELLRLQFRLGESGNQSSTETFPAPVIALIDSGNVPGSSRNSGLITAIRNVRDARSNIS